jgi:oligoribonuclease
MQRTTNAFAALAVADDADAADAPPSPTPAKPAAAADDDDDWLPASAPRLKRAQAGSGGQEASSSAAVTPPLNRPLIFLDLEMTGLDPAVDTILELAMLAVDGVDLRRVVAGPNLVVRASDVALAGMNAWCRTAHAASGLTDACRSPSAVTLAEAEAAGVAFVERVVGRGERATLAGSSVHADYAFLKAHTPALAAAFSHRLVDVSSVAELARRWFPAAYYARPALPKGSTQHRAADDAAASLAELRHYRRFVFREGAKEVAREVARAGRKK